MRRVGFRVSNACGHGGCGYVEYMLAQDLFSLSHPIGIKNALGRMLMRPVNTIPLPVDCTYAPCEYSYYVGQGIECDRLSLDFTLRRQSKDASEFPQHGSFANMGPTLAITRCPLVRICPSRKGISNALYRD